MKFCVLDLRENRPAHAHVLAGFRMKGEFDEKTAQLRQRFNEQGARKNGVVRKMIVKHLIRESNAFNRTGALALLVGGNSVQKKVAHEDSFSWQIAERNETTFPISETRRRLRAPCR